MNVHTCPAPMCDEQVPYSQVACKRHWFQIPKEIRRRVWSEYRKDSQSEAHYQAVSDAIESLQ